MLKTEQGCTGRTSARIPANRRLSKLAAGAALLSLWGCSPSQEDLSEAAPEPAEPVQLICDQDYARAFTELVTSAQEEILMVQWEYFSGEATTELLEVLARAVERGVAVQVLLDDHIEENHDAIQWMMTRGVDARLDSNSDIKIHAKQILVDEQRLMLGSTNWSNSSIRRNRECNILADSPLAASYLASWHRGLLEAPANRQPPDLQQIDEDIHVLVDDQLLPHLLERIAAAAQRIDFSLYATWLQPDNLQAPAMQVFNALTEAVQRGVQVRGIADYSDWNLANNSSNRSAVQWLRARGVEMRWEDPETTTHAKVFLIDEGLQLQTANISSGGLRWNREVGAWTEHPVVIHDIADWFESLWSNSTDNLPEQ